jgi:hypothetical protein
VRGTHAEVPDRFLLDGETRRRPLKGRGHRASRTIPAFTVLRPVLARHLKFVVHSAHNSGGFARVYLCLAW